MSVLRSVSDLWQGGSTCYFTGAWTSAGAVVCRIWKHRQAQASSGWEGPERERWRSRGEQLRDSPGCAEEERGVTPRFSTLLKEKRWETRGKKKLEVLLTI